MALEVSIHKQLKDFSLDVEFSTDNGSLGILGASGCGKSMTLKCIAGIEKPDSGYIRLNGQTLFDSKARINLPPRKRNVGYLFQNYALFPTMTVRENIGISVSGPDKKDKVDTFLKRFQLEKLEKRYPSELSGGEQQRTALARMMIRSPKLLMFDEPFSALDAWLKDQLLRQFSNLFSEYTGDILIVSHNRDEIYQLSQRLAIMGHGTFITTGTTEDVFKNPRTVGGARLTGCKNISSVHKVDAHHYEAVDWGLTLYVEEPPLINPESVGIRAHDLIVRKETKGTQAAPNTFCLRCAEHMETPFEDIFLLTSDPSSAQPLWWKRAKTSAQKETYPTDTSYSVTLPEADLIWLEDRL